jgi:hypothetical protein
MELLTDFEVKSWEQAVEGLRWYVTIMIRTGDTQTPMQLYRSYS